MKALIRGLATLGPIGYAPIAPATVASAAVALVGWFLPAQPLTLAVLWLAAGTAVGVWLCGEAEKDLGHDAHPIVFDELIGQSIALLLVPRKPLAFVVAFVLFRIFDIWKPLGAREAQRLPGGLGVMVDDVMAGLMALGLYHLGSWLVFR